MEFGANQSDKNTVPFLPYNMFRLHGNVDQLERVSVYKSFAAAERGVMFCTDVAARGVDFPGVTWIVQYDTPGSPPSPPPPESSLQCPSEHRLSPHALGLRFTGPSACCGAPPVCQALVCGFGDGV